MANTRNKRVNSKVEQRRDEGKEKFLAQLEEMPIIQVVASHCGIHRSTYYRWYNEDPDFKKRADKALGSGEFFINDMMESILIKKAKEGNMTAVIFWLKFHSKTYIDIKRYEHFHKFEPQPLTEERKKQIAESIIAWNPEVTGEKVEEDERDSDYEIPSYEETPQKEKGLPDDTAEDEEESEYKSVPQPKSKHIARKYQPEK